ncbi:porin [Pararoseomonas indoligenes]|uniref:Porin n=1 Tax=Roseomonas indoligenes TaxID=2820811 RepID=A0A940S4Q8_9PROT|nr:porin [Pararoseomonas indoligenes]MBP0493571.1 porin [Pararoseomonas indoligenes]
MTPERSARGGPAVRKLLLASAAGAGLLCATLPASAQTVQELRAQLNALQRRIDQLETAQRRADQRNAELTRAARPVTGAAPAQAPAAPGSAPAQGAPPTALARGGSSAAGGADQAPPQVTSAIPVQAQRADSSDQWRGSFPGSFRVPGTDTSVRLYGFAKLNMSGDLGPRNRSDTINGQSIPLSHGANGARQPGDFQASGRRSRLGIETRTPFGAEFGEVRTQVEIDFAGQTNDLTTQGTSNAYTPRLRQAFAEFGQFQDGGWGTVLVGQSFSLFADTPLVPLQWLNDWTPLAMDAVRQAQLRYSRRLGDGITVKVALENSYSDITATGGTSYPDANGGAGFGINQVPDLTAQAIWEGRWGFAALRGMLRQIRISNEGATSPAQRYSDSALGFGIGATGAVNLIDKRLILAGSAHYGQGLGRYLDSSSAGFGAVTSFGLPAVASGGQQVDTVDVAAAMVGLQYHWTETLRTNASLHWVRLSYPDYVRNFAGCAGAGSGTVCDAVNRSIWAAAVNLIWSPVKPIDLGIEYIHAERSLENRDVNGARGGRSDRIQASAIVRF